MIYSRLSETTKKHELETVTCTLYYNYFYNQYVNTFQNSLKKEMITQLKATQTALRKTGLVYMFSKR